VWGQSHLCTYLVFLNKILIHQKHQNLPVGLTVITKQKGTARLTVKTYCVKRQVAALADNFYHVPFMKNLQTGLTHRPPFPPSPDK